MFFSNQKSDFVNLYDADCTQNEFLYNLLHLALLEEIGDRCGPTRYDKNACTFVVYPELDFEKIKEKSLKLLYEIESISMLYDYQDPKSIFLDKRPTFLEKDFKYLCYRELYTFENLQKEKPLLIEKLKNAQMTKKSTLYKVVLKNSNKL